MSDAAKRVALLARPGAACDNLQSALKQAGAELVLVADPTESDLAAVAAAAPQAVLVALEPSVEDALDGFDQVLQDPAMIVIYDEVAVAAKREGWDAARWVRHLAAKLGGHQDVLPPGAGSDDAVAPPLAPAPMPAAAPPPTFAVPPPAPAPEMRLEIETEPELDQDQEPTPAFDAAPEVPIEMVLEDAPAEATHEGDAIEFDAAGSDLDFGDLSDEMKALLAGEASEAPSPREPDESIPAIDWDAPAPVSLDDPTPEPLPEPAPEPAPEPEPTPVPSAPAPVDFSGLSLVDIEGESTGVAGSSSPGTGSRPQGAVVVMAGIGGPDAVRQFLAAVPAEGLPRAVVVRQRLDGGRHDRLVQQMQRATALPVELAEAGTRLQPGRIYILPDGMAVDSQAGGGNTFSSTEQPVPVLAGLLAADSAILLLSGTDPGVVPEAMDAAAQGAMVAAPALEDCFDSAATAALLAAAGEATTPAAFAQRLAARWLSLTS